jgi:hypothetical protein
VAEAIKDRFQPANGEETAEEKEQKKGSDFSKTKIEHFKLHMFSPFT